MRNLMIVMAITLIALLPLTAAAQEQTPQAPPSEPMAVGVDPARFLVVAAGVVAGAIIMEALIATDLAVLTGAVAGGFITDWWYGPGQESSLAHNNKYRTASLQPETPEPLQLASTSQH